MKTLTGLTGTIVAGRQRIQQIGGSEMNGLAQVVVYMWFLPMVLFIVMPLCIGAVWWPISLFVKLVRREAAQEGKAEMVRGEAS